MNRSLPSQIIGLTTCRTGWLQYAVEGCRIYPVVVGSEHREAPMPGDIGGGVDESVVFLNPLLSVLRLVVAPAPNVLLRACKVSPAPAVSPFVPKLSTRC